MFEWNGYSDIYSIHIPISDDAVAAASKFLAVETRSWYVLGEPQVACTTLRTRVDQHKSAAVVLLPRPSGNFTVRRARFLFHPTLTVLRETWDTRVNRPSTTNDERRTTNDERRTTNDERRTTNDERRTTNDLSAGS